MVCSKMTLGALALATQAYAATVQVSDFSELKAAISSCSGPSITAGDVIELTADIVVTETLRIGKGTSDVIIQSSGSNKFKLTPGASFKDSTLTIGGTFCSSSGSISNLTFSSLKFSGVTNINGGITLGPVYIGALGADTDTIIFDNVDFENNLSPNGGLSPAGLRIDQGTVTINECTFQNNTANGIAGGALWVGSSASVTVDDTTFSNNGKDLSLGGAAAYIKGDAAFTNCIFRDNEVASSGKGIVVIDSATTDASFTDCTFSGNVAEGGANDIYFKKDGGDLTVSPCTGTDVPTCSGASCPTCLSAGGGGGNNDLNNAIAAAVAFGTTAIIGVAVGGVVVFALFILACVMCCCNPCKKNRAQVVVVNAQAPTQAVPMDKA